MSKFRGSGRVESIYFQISQVGSGRVKKFLTVTGRVGSGRVGSRGFQISRVGSGRFMWSLKLRGSGGVMTREIQVTRWSGHYDSRVVFGRRAGQIRGSGLESIFLQTYSCLPKGHHRRATLVTRGSCPRVLNYTILATSCLKVSFGAIPRTPSAY